MTATVPTSWRSSRDKLSAASLDSTPSRTITTPTMRWLCIASSTAGWRDHHNFAQSGLVAARAGSSKESLYVWFGSKEGLVAELIRRQSARTNTAVESALASSRAIALRTEVRQAFTTIRLR